MYDAMRQGWTVTRVSAHWYRGVTAQKRKPLVFFAKSFSELIEKMAAYEDAPLRAALQKNRREQQRATLIRNNFVRQANRIAASL